MSKRETGRRRGREAGAGAKCGPQAIQNWAAYCRQLYPSADLDFVAELLRFDRERLASQPSLSRFPELKGHIELLVGEREGFIEASGLDETAAAFHYSAATFVSRRINTRYLARWDLLPALEVGCTNVFFPDGVDGVTIADNRDVPLSREYREAVMNHRPANLLKNQRLPWVQGAVSSAALFDEEPDCCFPADPQEYDLMPEECLNEIDSIVEFMTRYNEFWGPSNRIFADRHGHAVAAEKMNCRVSFRRPDVNGCVAVTACATLDPELFEIQLAGARRAMAEKGETEESSLDYQFHLAARRRYERLVKLANEEAKRGATLWGALAVASDHAVPPPERVCLAGEKLFPDKEPLASWSVTNHAAVITGDQKRCLYRAVRDFEHPVPVYEQVPELMLGPDVAMRADWQADVDSGRCKLAPPA